MKKLFKQITVMSTVACGIFLISCQEEGPAALIQPADKGSELVQAPPVMVAGYRLTKNGNETLTYHTDGRVKQVSGTDNVIYAGYSTYRIDYEYAANSIVATRYQDNVKESRREWSLQNGRAVALKRTKYNSDGVTVSANIEGTYQYNALDQLKKIVMVGQEKKTYELTYDNHGNVIKFSLVKNTKKGDEFENLMKYEYTEYVGGSLETDKGKVIDTHVFSHTLGWLGDPYLPVFGKFGKHLLKKSIRTYYPATYKYAYILDANGYVKEQKTLKMNGELIETKALHYALPTKERI
jgi:hypothetical protein